jgi:O-antigen/teichoic acid export membrane protein
LLLVVIPVVLIAFIWAEDFYRLWIGEKYILGNEFSSVALLLQILLVGTVLSYSSNVAGQILMASGFIRSLALVQVSGAAINLIACLLLIPHFQLVGVAMASVSAVLVVDVIGIPILLARHVGMNVRSFIVASWSRLAIVSLSLPLIFLGIRKLGDSDSWSALMAQGAAAGFIGLVIVGVLGLKSEERQYFMDFMLRRAGK